VVWVLRSVNYHKQPNEFFTNDRTKSLQTTEKASKDLYKEILTAELFLQKNKYFSARWFNLLIFRKMMAVEFECGYYWGAITYQGSPCKDGVGKVHV